jgi:hypothetical protein
MGEAPKRTWRELATDWKVWLALAVCAIVAALTTYAEAVVSRIGTFRYSLTPYFSSSGSNRLSLRSGANQRELRSSPGSR